MQAALFIDEATREALRRASARLDGAEAAAQPHAMSQALADMGRCYVRLNATAAAEACLTQALTWARLAGATEAVLELLCETAEVAATLAQQSDAEEPGSGHAARERARDLAFEAGKLAPTLADPCRETQWLLQVGEVLMLCGDLDEATLVQQRAFDRLDAPVAAERSDPRRLSTVPGQLHDH